MKITNFVFDSLLKKNFVFEKNPKIAVGVSGGPDSMALTFLLNNWINKNKGALIVLIIDHGIRKESYVESIKIQRYLNQNKIKAKIIRINKKKVLKKNMQEARHNRYNKLLNYCKKNNILHLFLGHHYDDNIETFLMRRIGGSNFEGLRSMDFKINIASIQIKRPFLSFTKAEIVNFNRLNNIYFLEDPSNHNLNYTRVVIRDFLLKHSLEIKKIRKDFLLIQKNFPLYKTMIFQIFHKINVDTSANYITINYKKFSFLDKEIQIKIVEIIFKYLFPHKNLVRYLKIKNMLNFISTKSETSNNLAGMKVNKNKFNMNFMN